MAITKTKTPPQPADKSEGEFQQAKPVADAVPPSKKFTIELVKISRYFYGTQLYIRGEHYIFDEDGARHMLSLRDPQDLPVFRMAKPKTKMVEVVDDSAKVVPMSVKPPQVDRVVMDLQDFKYGQEPKPLGKIDLGDDDPETAERLRAIDEQGKAEAGLIDTAGAQTV